MIPEKIQDSILQGGPWAAMFLLSVIVSGAILTVMWRALREADARACSSRDACAAEVSKTKDERIAELRTVVDAMNAYNRVMTDQARAIETRGKAVSDLAEGIAKMTILIEGYQKYMTPLAERLEAGIRGISDRIGLWVSKRSNMGGD